MRIQAYLDARYLATDVWRTFETKLGQTIDCIDWSAQPSVKAMAAKGTPITKIPTPPPLPNGMVNASSTIPDWGFNGAPDKNGVPRTCAPKGVAMVRVTVAEILAAGGLDAYLARRTHRVAPPPGTYNSPGYAHEQEQFTGGGLNPAITFGTSVLSINDPILPAPTASPGNWVDWSSHSLSQTWMVSGNGWYNPGCEPGLCLVPGDSACTQSCYQTVEVGWERNADAANDPPGPHSYFFIYTSINGYNIDCRGVNDCRNESDDSDAGTSPFHYYPGNWYTDNEDLPDNLPGSNWQQWELQPITFNTYNGSNTGNWWLWVNGSYIGWFDSSFFTGTMQNTAQDFRAGGEVYDDTSTWVVPMGSGASATAGVGQAAYMHDFMACAINQGCSFDFSVVPGTDRGAYNNSTYNPNPTGWNNAFFFGDAPADFWGQSYNYASPQNWAQANSYVGECGTFAYIDSGNPIMPVIGLSKDPWGLNEAHAVLCGMNDWGDANYPNCSSSNATIVAFGYNYRNANQGNNQLCMGDYTDWDPGMAKGECPCNDYVAAVEQDESGRVSEILCCPGTYWNPNEASLTHSNCDVQTFYSSDSIAFTVPDNQGDTSPDWDPYYYKGQCPSGEYVAGVSTDVSSLGALNALLCCTN